MSKGGRQDGGVMNDQTTTFPWQHTQMTSIHPRRISLSLHSERKGIRRLEERRIISGVDFGGREFEAFQKPFRRSAMGHHRKSRGETEPVWVSILGGVGIAIGTIACWILV